MVVQFCYLFSQPHSLEGVQCKKGDKEKKKNTSEADQSNSKLESRDSHKLNNKDQIPPPPKPRGRKRLAETAAVTEHINFVQVRIIYDFFFFLQSNCSVSNVNLFTEGK